MGIPPSVLMTCGVFVHSKGNTTHSSFVSL
jgi:hypothetical protein